MKHPRSQTHLAVGERILLRSPTRADRDDFIALVKRSRKLHSSWVSPPKSAVDFDEYLARNRVDDFEAALVCERLTAEIIGVINVSQIFRRAFQSAYLGYWVGAGHAGQGYMTEAMRLLLSYAFRELELHRLEANIQPENAASIRLAQRCGFLKEGYSPRYLKIAGRWRDHERWAITREGWRAAPLR